MNYFETWLMLFNERQSIMKKNFAYFFAPWRNFNEFEYCKTSLKSLSVRKLLCFSLLVCACLLLLCLSLPGLYLDGPCLILVLTVLTGLYPVATDTTDITGWWPNPKYWRPSAQIKNYLSIWDKSMTCCA